MSIVESLKKSFILLLLVLLLALAFQVKSVTIDPNIQFIVGNETYTVNQTMDFNSITIASSYILFNSTGFYVTSGDDITISLVYLSDDIVGAGDGDKIVEFYATTVGGVVWFNLSGFPVGNTYVVNRSGSPIAYPTANISGYISFSNSVWSTQQFAIFQEGAGVLDLVLPVISDVSNAFSNPVDIEPGFGWENFSCTVTDNVAVDQVLMNLTFPNATMNNVSMSNILGTNNSYYNTSFTQYGNYSYYIWADDTSNNTVVSSFYDLSLPPNWDINNDGVVNVFDHVLTSNHYDETGNTGWIREDVDNNGEIQVLDLVLVSNHYGETWWEV